ncbi:unnamed protein product [Choristocarpus tenellus]
MKVAVIAFGTRGDVQPLAILTHHLPQTSFCTKVVLISHSSHQELVESLWHRSCPDRDRHVFEFYPVDSPPIIWKGGSGSERVDDTNHDIQQDSCVHACQGAGLVIFNLFALEGFHIAEAMEVPCMVCQPYLIPTPMPCSFTHRMRRAYPHLFRQLLKGGRSPLPESLTGGPRSPVATLPPCLVEWLDVEHWMWPLFTDRWGPFRARLSLPLIPCCTYCPPVLYLFSSLVVEHSPFWPASVKLCGYLFPSSETWEKMKTKRPAEVNSGEKCPDAEIEGRSGITYSVDVATSPCLALPVEVEEFLSSGKERPLYVDFGSMWGMCPVGSNLALTLRTVLDGALQARMRCMVVLPTDCPPTRDQQADHEDRGVKVQMKQQELELVLGYLCLCGFIRDVPVRPAGGIPCGDTLYSGDDVDIEGARRDHKRQRSEDFLLVSMCW